MEVGRTAAVLAMAGVACPAIAAAEGPAVVLLLPPDSPAEGGEAVAAQLSDVAVRLEIERPSSVPADLRARIDLATDLARSHEALGTFWLEEGGGDFLLYLFEPEGARVLVRRVRATARDSALEEVAVIARSTTAALLDGSEIGMQPVAIPQAVPIPENHPEPARSSAPEPEPEPESAPILRLGLEYEGATFAREVPWQNGVRVSAAAALGDAWKLGAAYAFFVPLEPREGDVAISIERHPIEVFAGWETRAGPATIGAELGAVGDRIVRRTIATPRGLEATAPEARWALGAVGLLRALYPTGPVMATVAVGAEFFPDSADYVVQAGNDASVVTTSDLRLVVRAGMAVDAP